VSEQNVEIVRRGWEHFSQTGEPLPGILAPGFVWDMSTFRGWPEQPRYEGAEGTHAFLRDWGSAFEDWEIVVEAMHDAGDQVICVCRQHGRAHITGIAVDMQLALVFTLHDGRETHMHMYADPAEAFAAVGLSEPD
jgi:ketosteroid isomerase-like protein